MISPAFVAVMARYNAWQNRSLFAAATTLTDTERRANRGAFFGSIHNTLAHVFWVDRVWMRRLADPADVSMDSGQAIVANDLAWRDLCAERISLDEIIGRWAVARTADWLASELAWSNAAGNKVSGRLAWRVVAHMFNHQTHHRGQVHAMLTHAGVTPEDTDLFLLPDVEHE